MLALLPILVMLLFLCFLYPIKFRQREEAPHSAKYNTEMKKLWGIAQTSMKEHKPARAEKALLTILKVDEKNAAAYNRLGILYAKSQKYSEAIECFEIAQSLDSNPSSLHNAGLIYLETGAYEKAEMAFRQALASEGDVPARYIALAKTEEKLGKKKEAIQALESAYDLDGSVATLRQILAIYESMGDAEAMTATQARIEAKIVEETEAAEKKAASSRRARNHRRSLTVGARRTGVAPQRPAKNLGVSRRAPKATLPRNTMEFKKAPVPRISVSKPSAPTTPRSASPAKPAPAPVSKPSASLSIPTRSAKLAAAGSKSPRPRRKKIM
ncbi:tetratricopeptide repeat protein [Candidatus Saccharibacteria bacterium]|nr:tetratricopeptide repeat protein [Candidatus Saccharibacteria bacterium]